MQSFKKNIRFKTCFYDLKQVENNDSIAKQYLPNIQGA